MEGFPFGQIFVISLIRLAEPIAFTSLFPYVYFMIRDLGICKHEADISIYTGYLASTFSFFQAISAIYWGNASDKYGRKPVLMAGLFGCLLSLLLFGFSRSFGMAFLARSLMGLLNGNSAVVRCVIGEIAPKKRHLTLAFLVMPIAWNVGSIFGPLIGGSLARPAENDLLMVDSASFLAKSFPYALPNIVIAVIMLLGIAVTYLFLEETHPELRTGDDPGIILGYKLLSFCGVQIDKYGDSKIDLEINTETDLLLDSLSVPSEVQKDFWPSILSFKTLNPIISYLIMQAHFVVFNEFLPVFACFDAVYDNKGVRSSQFPFHLLGGLGYTSQKAGQVLSSLGFFGILILLALFPWIDRTFHPILFFRFALGVFPVLFCILPYCLLLLPHSQSTFEARGSPHADIFLYMFILVRVMFASSLGSTIMVRINENAPPGYVGIVNGLSISASAMAGCIGPLMWGYLMTLSQSLNYAWLSWWCLSLLTLVGFIQGFNIH